MRWVVAPCLAACGRLGFAPAEPSATDAAGDTSVDAIADACTTAELVDEFSDGVIDPRWEAFSEDAGMVVSEEADVLRVTLSGTVIDADRAAGIADIVSRDYRGRCIEVEVTRLPSLSTFSKILLGSALDHVGIQLSPGSIGAFERIAGVEQDSTGIDYDPVAHRVLRLAHTDAGVVLAVGPSMAGPFVELDSYAATTVDLTAAELAIQIQTAANSIDGMNETFEIDRVRVRAP